MFGAGICGTAGDGDADHVLYDGRTCEGVLIIVYQLQRISYRAEVLLLGPRVHHSSLWGLWKFGTVSPVRFSCIQIVAKPKTARSALVSM
jgi:hypothetical protein